MKNKELLSNRDLIILGFAISLFNKLFIEGVDISFVLNLIAIALISIGIVKIITEKFEKKEQKKKRKFFLNFNLRNKSQNIKDKIQKITLPTSIFLSVIILALTFISIQYLKQESIEKQLQTKLEIENKLSISEKKEECREIANNEKHWANYHSYYYDIKKGICIVEYENKDWNGDTLEEKKSEFKEKIKTSLENGTITQDEAIEKIKQFKQILERLEE